MWKRVYHIDGAVLEEIGEVVVAHQCSCRVEPLHDEHIPVFSHQLQL
jgi:hypothetical protein